MKRQQKPGSEVQDALQRARDLAPGVTTFERALEHQESSPAKRQRRRRKRRSRRDD